MSIGRHVDRAVDGAIIGFGTLANWLLNLIPYDEGEAKRYLAMSGAEALAEREAQCDVYEPDEVWAAEHICAEPDCVLPIDHPVTEVAEPLGEYPEVPAQCKVAGQTELAQAVANVLSREMSGLFLRGRWDFTTWAEHVAPEILRAIDRARSK